MTTTLHKKYFFMVLVMALLFGCSDDKGSKTPEIEKETFNAPAASPQQGKEKKSFDTAERPLLIGVVGPETSEEASYGLSVVDGVLAAAKRFNAQGGIEGKKIKVEHFDDKGSLKLTNDITMDLITKGAIAILSAPTGSSTFAPVHLVNDYKTIFISIGSRRHIEKSGPYIFRASISDEQATDDLIKFTRTTLGYANYALVTSSNYDFSLDMSFLFKKAIYKHNGAIKVETDSYDSYTGGLNMGTVIDAIKNSPDTLQAVVFTGGVDEGILLAKELKKAGLTLSIIGGEDLFSAEYLKGGDAVNGTLLYTTFSPNSSSPKVVEFRKEYGKGNPDRFAALAYDTFMMVAEAIKEAGSTSTSKVREALLNRQDFEGATGKTSFTSEGGPVKHPILYRVSKGEDGEGFVELNPNP